MSGAMKIFKSNGKQSGEIDRNGQQGNSQHQRSDSSISESTKRALNAFQEAVGDVVRGYVYHLFDFVDRPLRMTPQPKTLMT